MTTLRDVWDDYSLACFQSVPCPHSTQQTAHCPAGVFQIMSILAHKTHLIYKQLHISFSSWKTAWLLTAAESSPKAFETIKSMQSKNAQNTNIEVV